MPVVEVSITNPTNVTYTAAHPPAFTSNSPQAVPTNLIGIAPAGSTYSIAFSSETTTVTKPLTYPTTGLAFCAFDNSLNTFWRSAISYNTATGATTSGASFNGITGEWIRLNFPTGYTDYITHFAINGNNNKFWVLFGIRSDDTIVTVFDSLATATMPFNKTNDTPTIFALSTPGFYKAFVFLVTAVYGTNDGVADSKFASLRCLKFLNKTFFDVPVNLNLQLPHAHAERQNVYLQSLQLIHSNTFALARNNFMVYPPSAFGANNTFNLSNTLYGTGQYIASGSAVGAGFQYYLGVDKNLSTRWRSGGNTNSFTTNTNLGPINGEYFQIRLPNAIILQKFFMRTSSVSTGPRPPQLALVGSNNGTNWTVILPTSSSGFTSTIFEIMVDIPFIPPSYSYFRFICPSLGSAGYWEMTELELYDYTSTYQFVLPIGDQLCVQFPTLEQSGLHQQFKFALTKAMEKTTNMISTNVMEPYIHIGTLLRNTNTLPVNFTFTCDQFPFYITLPTQLVLRLFIDSEYM